MPDAGGAGVGLALVETCRTGSARLQAAAVAAVREGRAQVQWPVGLLSRTTLAGSDQLTLVRYSQWTDEAAALRFVRTSKPAWAEAVAAAVPNIERLGVVPYRVYGQASGSPSGGRPGCVVLVNFASESHEVAARWVDSMLRLGSVDTARTGMRAATFHISLAGTRVLNYAEWDDEASHVAAAASPKAPDEAKIVHSTPGVCGIGYERFLCWHSVAADSIRG